MPTTLLLDPAVLAPPHDADGATWSAYWARLIEWATDRRVRVGAHTFTLASQEFKVFAAVEIDTLDYPPHTRRERRRALGVLMSRVVTAHHNHAPGRLHPEHMVDEATAAALASDLSRCAEPALLAGVATDAAYWADQSDEGRCEPPPPDTFEFCYEPNAELRGESLARIASELRSKRVHIVGGQRERRVEQEIASMGADVQWSPCERHKKPTLDSWRSLQPGRDIAVCITGRIGHASSRKAENLAASAAVPFIEACQVGDIIPALMDRLRTSASS